MSEELIRSRYELAMSILPDIARVSDEFTLLDVSVGYGDKIIEKTIRGAVKYEPIPAWAQAAVNEIMNQNQNNIRP